MRLIDDTFPMDLFQDVKACFVLYRGIISCKTQTQRKKDKIELLNSAINNTWQSAAELSKKTGMSFHQAYKLLPVAVQSYDIDTKQYEWVDKKWRHISRTLYRRKRAMTYLSDTMFGARIPDVPCCAANTRRHVCMDD